jgi:general transcription factor 3C polypeptide 6
LVHSLFSSAISEAEPKPPSDETTPFKENTDKPSSSSKEAPSKEVNHLASVQKILKFRPINAEHPRHRAYQHKDKEI